MSSPTTIAAAAPDRPSVGRVFVRTCAAEWSRVWTVKATWWLLAVAGTIMVGIAAIAGHDAARDPDAAVGEPAWGAAEVVVLPAQFALLTIALLAVSSDYATGGIVPTMQWTPRRNVLFLARAAIAAGVATAAGVGFAAAASVAGYLTARPVLSLPVDAGIDVLSTVALVLAAGTLLAVGLGFLLRSTAGALVSVFLLLLVLPALLPQLGYDWLTDISDLLPGTSVIFLLSEEPRGRGLTTTSCTSALLAWAGSALLLGWLRLVRSDVDR